MILSTLQKEKIQEIARRHNLALLVLFGSHARGEGGAKSDFDLAYSSIEPLDLGEENKMAVELHSVFKTMNVDIVDLRRASPLLLKKVTEEGIPLYEIKESLFNILSLYALRIFRESENLNHLRRDYVLNRVEQFKKDVTAAR